MTCKDCIHYDNTIQDKVGKSDIEYHLCEYSINGLDLWKFVKNTDKPCKGFEDKDGTFYNGTEHRPRRLLRSRYGG